MLYRCDANGGNIRELSGNIEHDNLPWMLPSGQVIYTRWEYVDRSQEDFHHLWTMNPDGIRQTILYGNLNPGTVMLDAKPIPGSEKIVASLPVRFYVLCNLLCQVVSDVEPCLVTLKKTPGKPGATRVGKPPCREPKEAHTGQRVRRKGGKWYTAKAKARKPNVVWLSAKSQSIPAILVNSLYQASYIK